MTIAENRRARFEYHIEEQFEAGIVLEGWEIKAVRAGQVSNRRKMRTAAAVKIRTTKVSATGQENRPDMAGFGIGYWMFGVFFDSAQKSTAPHARWA